MRTRNWWAVPWSVAGVEGLGVHPEYVLIPRVKKKKPDPRLNAIQASTFHPLRKTRSRIKGSELEIRVAKTLNGRFYQGQPVLRRTPLSGGWSNGMGDICADPEQLRRVSTLIPLYVECKRGQGITFENLMQWLLDGQSKTYNGWWMEALGQGKGKDVLLVVQGDGMDPWVVVRASSPGEWPGLEVPLHAAKLFPLEGLEKRDDRRRSIGPD